MRSVRQMTSTARHHRGWRPRPLGTQCTVARRTSTTGFPVYHVTRALWASIKASQGTCSAKPARQTASGTCVAGQYSANYTVACALYPAGSETNELIGPRATRCAPCAAGQCNHSASQLACCVRWEPRQTRWHQQARRPTPHWLSSTAGQYIPSTGPMSSVVVCDPQFSATSASVHTVDSAGTPRTPGAHSFSAAQAQEQSRHHPTVRDAGQCRIHGSPCTECTTGSVNFLGPVPECNAGNHRLRSQQAARREHQSPTTTSSTHTPQFRHRKTPSTACQSIMTRTAAHAAAPTGTAGRCISKPCLHGVDVQSVLAVDDIGQNVQAR